MKVALLFLQMFLVSVASGRRTSHQSYGSSEVTHHAFACENQAIVLECPLGSNLRILRANYGRSDTTTCDPAEFGINSNLDICVTNSSDAEVRTQCENQTRCEFLVTNRVFTDTCPNTFKFLEVDFACVRKGYGVRTHTWYACEGNRMVLECAKGTELNIVRANYGRSPADVCDPSILNINGNANECGDNSSTGLVATMCNGQKRCQFTANNTLFTDPCFGTYKFLEVDFTCEKSDDDGSGSCRDKSHGSGSSHSRNGRHYATSRFGRGYYGSVPKVIFYG